MSTQFTEAQLTALVTAISQGAKTVEYEDKRITYNSLAEMLQLKRLMEKELGITTRTGRLKAEHSKGLE